ncbi:MAG: type II secretion system protein E, partial [Pseudomonadota bacterium]
MSLSYLQSSIDRLEDAKRDDVIEICINPDGSCWGEFQGDHFMSRLAQTLT